MVVDHTEEHASRWAAMQSITGKIAEFATLDWVDRFNNRRLLEPIGGIPLAEYEMHYWTGIGSTDSVGLTNPSLHGSRGDSTNPGTADITGVPSFAKMSVPLWTPEGPQGKYQNDFGFQSFFFAPCTGISGCSGTRKPARITATTRTDRINRNVFTAPPPA
jgi:hypothetical protein